MSFNINRARVMQSKDTKGLSTVANHNPAH